MSTAAVFKSDDNKPDDLIAEFFIRNDYFLEDDKKRIRKAWNLLCEKSADTVRSSGHPFYLHPLRVADILAQSRLDADTIIAAILHSILEFDVAAEQIKDEFLSLIHI